MELFANKIFNLKLGILFSQLTASFLCNLFFFTYHFHTVAQNIIFAIVIFIA